ncbi:DUF4232 domain-containing protein [Streptomyces sp. E-15]
MNTLRNHSVLLAAAGTVLTLSLTACQSEGKADSAPKATVAATVAATGKAADGKDTSASGTTDAAEPARSTESKSPRDSAAGSAGTTGEQASAAARVCTSRDVRVTAATQDGPPYTHIVLTAKNTSGSSCRLAGAPHIQFLESHKQDVPVVAKSKPASPVVLTPGAPAYALVKLSDGGVDEENEPVSAFSVMLEGDSTVIAVSAPGSGIAVDPAKALTGYWTPELRNGADDF